LNGKLNLDAIVDYILCAAIKYCKYNIILIDINDLKALWNANNYIKMIDRIRGGCL